MAELKKENGNQLFKIKPYRSALPLYSEAIILAPEAFAYYGNRAACYMMLNRHIEAMGDARKSIQLDPTFVKGYTRIVKCAVALGDLVTAETAANQAEMLGSVANEVRTVLALKQHDADATKAYQTKDFRKVVYCRDKCLDMAPACEKYKLMKAECLAFLRRYQESQEIANDIIHFNKGSADAIHVRGWCLYYEDIIDKTFRHFLQILIAPDHAKAMEQYKRAKQLKKKKEEGKELFKVCKFRDAGKVYTEALEIDPLNGKTNAKLYFNRATALSRLIKLKEAIADCTAALKLDVTYLKALLRWAKCYMDIEQFETALKDYKKAAKTEESRKNRRLLQEAKLALKKCKRKDYYKILGVNRKDFEDDIKKAYKKRALIHHPDRHSNATDAEMKEQDKKFEDLSKAYGILLDPKEKSRYDSGHGMDDFESGMSVDRKPLKNVMDNLVFKAPGVDQEESLVTLVQRAGISARKEKTEEKTGKRARTTIMKPFSFEQRDKAATKKKKEALQKVLQTEKDNRKFKATPIPKTSQSLKRQLEKSKIADLCNVVDGGTIGKKKTEDSQSPGPSNKN